MSYDKVVSNAKNIPELFFSLATKSPEEPLYAAPRSEDGAITWFKSTYKDSAARVRAIASFLTKQGVTPGTSIAIISGTRPEWMEIDLAILSVGGITVSIYPSLPHNDCGFILYDSDAQIVFAENEEQLNKLRTLELEETLIPQRDELPASKTKLSFRTIVTIESVTQHPRAVSLSSILEGEKDAPIPTQFNSLDRATIASLVYTSGTTGPSKGVVQTHGNHLANVEQAIQCGMFALDGNLFLFLPLAHSFARLIGYLGFLTPAFIKFCGVADTRSSKVDLVKVAKEMRSADANVIPSVPRLFEKIKATLEEKAQSKNIQGRLLATVLWSAQTRYRAYRQEGSFNIFASLLFFVTASIRKKIRLGIFGPHFRHAISGGAKMPADVSHFFWSLGIPIYEGYGLTETCVATNVNRVEKNRIGTVGPALNGVQIKIATDGEILFKGPNITKQYRNRPLATREAWDEEGWFHTGDIGHLDGEFLVITDRKKDLVITAGGKKVPPQKIENILTQSPFIAQAVYCGDEKPYCVALVTLNIGTIKEALKAKKITPVEPLHTQPEVIALLDAAREATNKQLSSFEAVKKIAIIPEEFTVENGILTPTLKVKRKVVLSKYKDLYESLY